MTDFTAQMDKLAAEIAKEAVTEGNDKKAFGDKIDAFKALMPYYALLRKNRGDDPEDDGLPTFDRFTRDIHATEIVDGEGESGLRDRRRNGN